MKNWFRAKEAIFADGLRFIKKLSQSGISHQLMGVYGEDLVQCSVGPAVMLNCTLTLCVPYQVLMGRVLVLCISLPSFHA